ncbi:MAG: hypothetical protein AAB954_01240 [Patescibacteria group bacterium]
MFKELRLVSKDKSTTSTEAVLEVVNKFPKLAFKELMDNPNRPVAKAIIRANLEACLRELTQGDQR